MCTEEYNDPVFSWKPLSTPPVPDRHRAQKAFQVDHMGFSFYVTDIYLHRRSTEISYHPVDCLANQPQVCDYLFFSLSLNASIHQVCKFFSLTWFNIGFHAFVADYSRNESSAGRLADQSSEAISVLREYALPGCQHN